MSNTQLQELLAGQPQATQEEIIRINTDARPRALQVALLVPLIAGVVGLLLSFRMVRLPDIKPSASLEGVLGGLITSDAERRRLRKAETPQAVALPPGMVND